MSEGKIENRNRVLLLRFELVSEQPSLLVMVSFIGNTLMPEFPAAVVKE